MKEIADQNTQILTLLRETKTAEQQQENTPQPKPHSARRLALEPISNRGMHVRVIYDSNRKFKFQAYTCKAKYIIFTHQS